jgi:hypothetical protein
VAANTAKIVAVTLQLAFLTTVPVFIFTNVFEFLFMLYTFRQGITIVAVAVICRRLAIAALVLSATSTAAGMVMVWYGNNSNNYCAAGGADIAPQLRCLNAITIVLLLLWVV